MWGLPTIIAINQKLAEGKSIDQTYVECGIRVPGARGADAYARFGNKSPLRGETATEEVVEASPAEKDTKAKNVA